MAKSKIRGITIELGGDASGLISSFKKATSESKSLQTQLNDVNKLLKFDPKNVELLSQKQELLTKKIESTKTTLSELDKIQKQMDANGVDKTSSQYMALQREIEDNTIALKNLEKEAGTTNKQLNEIKPGANWDKLESKIKDIQTSLTNVGTKMKEVGKDMTLKVTAPILAGATASFKFASDLEDAMGASDQIFKDSSKEIESWSKDLASYFGISRSEAITYANTMGAMLQNIGGLSEEEAAKMSATLVELGGDLTAMFGGTTESAIQALTGALKGNNSMLDNYGMGVNDATIKTKAFEMGLYDGTGQMDLATKQAATLALIMEQTADAQGQAAREAEGASGSTRALITELKNLSASLGEELLPIITPIIQSVVEFIQKFSELDSGTKQLIITIGLLVAAIGPVIGLLGTLATLAGALNIAMLPMIGTIALIVAAIAAVIAIGIALYNNWETIKTKAGDLWAYIKEKFDAIKESIMNSITEAKEWVGKQIDKIKKFFDFKWELPKLKMPHVKIQGSFSLLPPKVPKFSIDWYADGGIFNSPTIIPTLTGFKGVGEGRTGGEVVAPLRKLEDMFNNSIRNHQQPIVNNNYFIVDGKQIATEIAPETDYQLGRIQLLKGR